MIILKSILQRLLRPNYLLTKDKIDSTFLHFQCCLVYCLLLCVVICLNLFNVTLNVKHFCL